VRIGAQNGEACDRQRAPDDAATERAGAELVFELGLAASHGVEGAPPGQLAHREGGEELAGRQATRSPDSRTPVLVVHHEQRAKALHRLPAPLEHLPDAARRTDPAAGWWYSWRE
jgi:hypothetical protein